MMPSVIPARLQFQCGHAALVTLPRVKGETTTQRNDRVAREKSAALARECDFCTPANGTNHVAVAEIAQAPVVAEVVVYAAEPPVIEIPAVQAQDEPQVQPERDAQPQPEAQPESPVQPAAQTSQLAATSQPETLPQPETHTNAVAVATPKQTRQARGARTPKRQPVASLTEIARGRRFLVEYRIERLLRADSIRDALRQVTDFGPSAVVAITRED